MGVQNSMRKSFLHFIILIMIICLFPQLLLAKTGYVSDMLLLTLRQGPGNSHDVTKTLASGTPVLILGEENGFYKVELKSKELGWVDKKFIIFDLPKTLIIEQLNQDKARLEEKISKLEATVESLENNTPRKGETISQQAASLDVALKKALADKDRIKNLLSDSQKKYDTLTRQSQNTQTIIKENKILQKKNETLSRDLETLKEKNNGFFKSSMIKWFLSGVCVLLLGWIVGHSVSSKKRKYNSLLD